MIVSKLTEPYSLANDRRGATLDDETAAAIEQINFRLDHIEKHLVDMYNAGPSIRYSPVGRGDFRANNASSIPDDVTQLLQAGNRLGAIGRYRELTGVTTQEAADILDGIAPAK
jgi:hypothetical protein